MGLHLRGGSLVGMNLRSHPVFQALARRRGAGRSNKSMSIVSLCYAAVMSHNLFHGVAQDGHSSKRQPLVSAPPWSLQSNLRD